MKRFEGKNVVITGAAAGIGQATAQRIAEEGGNVALIDMNAEGLVVTKKLAEALGVKAWVYECNVTDGRSEEHTSELQSPYVISYAVFCLKKKTQTTYVIDRVIEYNNHSLNLRTTVIAVRL